MSWATRYHGRKLRFFFAPLPSKPDAKSLGLDEQPSRIPAPAQQPHQAPTSVPVSATQSDNLPPAAATPPAPKRTAPKSTDPATEPQLRYLERLAHDKGWNDEQKQEAIKKVLGSAKNFSALSKREASQLIDAWKTNK